jgi:hypothetical protein
VRLARLGVISIVLGVIESDVKKDKLLSPDPAVTDQQKAGNQSGMEKAVHGRVSHEK